MTKSSLDLKGTPWHRVALACAGLLLVCNVALAQEDDAAIATLEAFRGGVTVVRLGAEQPTTPSMALRRDDIVVTRQGRATVRFRSDGSLLRIGPDSRVQIDESAQDRGITVLLGRIWSHVVRLQDRSTTFRSGSTIAAVRGTEVSLTVAMDGNETQVSVLEGLVEAETDAGSLLLSTGQSAVGRTGAAPTRGLAVRPQDAVQWALYYLPVMQIAPGDLGAGAWQDAVRSAGDAYRQGNLQQAIDTLAAVDGANVNAATFFTYRASLQLASGSVEAAEADIERAFAIDADDSDALSLQAIVAVVNNDAAALATAERAVAADPGSATAQIALSYARQAQFDIEGARESLEQAVTLDADDALAWARLAEIRSAEGDLGGALEAAERAVALEPNLSRTQTVLGFAYLTRVQTGEAIEAFQRAIGFDQDDPLPRLGLGLAHIREGRLDEGNRELEVAVSLDPAQAVVRSYLGKGYFEARQTGLVDREFQVAKDSDPNDPTPWLYDAIAKQTTNRPVEALESLQQAIALNDNRAVYRSRLLLDSDLAARSASLGRVYSDLGFQDLALVEGWTSVNTDPTNFSAHRLLADSYASQPRHEIARVSELFQSQMLQPLNTTPIQPRLGESNLFLIAAGGPGALSFNEFNGLFNRDGLNLQATGALGNEGLGSGEAIVSGIFDRASFSVGYSHFEADGWREGAIQDDDIANVFVQTELSPKTSIQAEYRYRDGVRGDLDQRFYEDSFQPGARVEEERNAFRVGGRHAFSPGSILLASVTYADTDEINMTEDFLGPGTSLDVLADTRAYGVEGQYLFRSGPVDLTAGVGFFDIQNDIAATLDLGFFVNEFPLIESEFDHLNLYGYANLKPRPDVTVTLGGSFDRLTGDLEIGNEGEQFNPKVGLTWTPVPGTTIRAAAFRGMKRTLITDQTLEPTQVAGFNQFFDDLNLTESWRYGGAVDQKFGSHVFAGVEGSTRDLTVPRLDLNLELQEAAWREYMARTYVFVTPHPHVAIRGQYVFERFTRDDELTLGFKELETHRIPLGIGYFHPSGVSASLSATYRRQTGEIENFFVPIFTPEESDFWLVDLAFNYRLPRRYGFLSFGISNLLDEEFDYFEIDFDNPTIIPSRSVFARFTIAVS